MFFLLKEVEVLLSSRNEMEEERERGARLCICSPLGRSLLLGLKSSKQSCLASNKKEKAWIQSPAALLSFPNSLSVSVKLLPLSLCNSLSLSRAVVVQLHGSGGGSEPTSLSLRLQASPSPSSSFSFSRSHLTPAFPLPPPTCRG